MTTSSINLTIYNDPVTIEYESWPTEPQTMIDPGVQGGIEIVGIYFSDEGDNWLEYLTDSVIEALHDAVLMELSDDEP